MNLNDKEIRFIENAIDFYLANNFSRGIQSLDDQEIAFKLRRSILDKIKEVRQ